MFAKFLLTFLIAVVGVRGYSYRITHLSVPDSVPPEVKEVEFECHYDFYNLTVVSWSKGIKEFFRYKLDAFAEKRIVTSPIAGVGKVELVYCGPTACKIRLSELTEEATGLYICLADCEGPHYHFDTRNAYMQVETPPKLPILVGLADEFSEGQEMSANCSGVPVSTNPRWPNIQWYINGEEFRRMEGLPALKINASRSMFLGVPPEVTVQCAEDRYGRVIYSNEMQAKWKASDDNVLEDSNQWLVMVRLLLFGGLFSGFAKKIMIILSQK